MLALLGMALSFHATHSAAVKITNRSKKSVLARINDATVTWDPKKRTLGIVMHTVTGIPTLGITPAMIEVTQRATGEVYANFRLIKPGKSITFHSGPKAIKKVTFLRTTNSEKKIVLPNITYHSGEYGSFDAPSESYSVVWYYMKRYNFSPNFKRSKENLWEASLPKIKTFITQTNIKPLSLINHIEYTGWGKAKVV